ncbi:NarK family nitrate/nitrite MFS transporter [Vibrio sp. SS-MA-C1-2]|uniref:NarK family nitrate/nitrite MFS transporter n=1 Tax=Vibrio sp. SS-MA-C1-2 TaxID=2908646 RepID=UPI001F2D062C|nr:NarK family nitrate/nitrite MFS transporter [Vibrio sp. SS-MA-C1-2]UJF18180.1 NarK family nitrate/nitrite MFS transporter [Vibrio sp. SS-MA-C1-2]
MTNKVKVPLVITDWNPEDSSFWQNTGQSVAKRNLWISIPCLLLSFCVWMLFSTLTINFNKVGFNFTNDQLFMLTALPAISGALFRIPYSFMVPIVGGRRWTAISTLYLVVPCLWLGFAINDPTTSYTTFVIISLLCGIAGGNFASSMANISFFFPKQKQGGALGLNGGLGNLGVSTMQFVAPIVIFINISIFPGDGVTQSDQSSLWLANAAFVWIPFIIIATLAAWLGMNDLSEAKSSFSEQLPIVKRPHMWLMSILYLWTFGSFIGFSAGFAMLTKIQFPDVDIIKYAFIGPLLGALVRPVGGALSDKFGGVKVTTFNFVAMAVFTVLVFLTIPAVGEQGSFILFFGAFMLLFLTSGLGSGSTFQMIAVIFREITIRREKASGVSDEAAAHIGMKDSAAALGFISAIGAIGGFFIPKAFGTSLALTGSPVGALKLFLCFYVICIFITWLVYGKYEKKSE